MRLSNNNILFYLGSTFSKLQLILDPSYYQLMFFSSLCMSCIYLGGSVQYWVEGTVKITSNYIKSLQIRNT